MIETVPVIYSFTLLLIYSISKLGIFISSRVRPYPVSKKSQRMFVQFIKYTHYMKMNTTSWTKSMHVCTWVEMGPNLVFPAKLGICFLTPSIDPTLGTLYVTFLQFFNSRILIYKRCRKHISLLKYC